MLAGPDTIGKLAQAVVKTKKLLSFKSYLNKKPASKEAGFCFVSIAPTFPSGDGRLYEINHSELL